MKKFDYTKYISQFSFDKEYNKSQENLLVCQPYLDLCSDISMRIKRNINGVIKNNEIIKTNRIEYANNCKNIHRGYYCPSPLYDILVSNSCRGHIKRKSDFDHSVNFAYHFDDDNKIFLIDEYTEGKKVGIEKIYYKDNKSFGFRIVSDLIESFSQCEYNAGLISSYAFALIDPFDFFVTSLEFEEYEYNSDNLIYKMDLFSFIPSEIDLSHRKYHFTHDNNGMLCSYRVEDYFKGQRIKLGVDDNLLYVNIPKYKMRKV